VTNEKVFRLLWLNKEYHNGLVDILQRKVPRLPLQIEIHPYHHTQEVGCNNNCVWCTRLRDKYLLKQKNEQGIDPDRLISFITSLKGKKISRIVLSGNSTEPLLYPGIRDVIKSIKRAGMTFKLFTNFRDGEKVIDVLISEATNNDLVRISLDAFSEKSYQKTHRPTKRTKAFYEIRRNIENLLEEKRSEKSPLAVEVVHLLTIENSSERELHALLEWGYEVGVRRIRFSLPLIPTLSNRQIRFCRTDVDVTTGRLNKAIKKFRKNAQTSNMEIQIRGDNVHEEKKGFSVCAHWKVVAVLGARGKFWPCTSTSIFEYMHLGRGDINDRAFDFCEFWHDLQEWNIDVLACPDCTRFEYDVNRTVDELIWETRNRETRKAISATVNRFFKNLGRSTTESVDNKVEV